jgi:hypothetical protein
LTANWQTFAMANATIATQVHQALDAHRDFTTQIALCRQLADFVAQFF